MGLEGLIQCSANYVPLTPISFLEKAARIHGDGVSIHFGSSSYSWKETYERCIMLASALSRLGICRGDIVAAVAPNIPELYELHFAVPMAGAILAPLNPLLEAAMLSVIVQDLEPKIIFVDYQSLELALQMYEELSERKSNIPLLFLIPNPDLPYPVSLTTTELPMRIKTYNELLSLGQPDFEIQRPENECDPILINYTSGSSTGTPKGVVSSHRASYLNSLGEIFRSDLTAKTVFLWTHDMFRANGWGFNWAVAALGGINVCLRDISAKAIFDSIFLYNVTHLSGKPYILNIIATADADHEGQRHLPHSVYMHIAGLLPPIDVRTRIEEMGFRIVHRYGMTEILGPSITSSWNYNAGFISDFDGSVRTKSSQERIIGQCHFLMEEADVKDPETMESVPNDGKTIGEVMFRGNTLMSGYLKNAQKTQKAFRGGWYHTKDLAVKHQDGYIQLKDRAQDIIVTDRNNYISTLEIEAVLLNHPKVLEAAVVGMPDDYHIDQVPCAFVKLKTGLDATEKEIIDFCAGQLPRLMTPRSVVFGDLPASSTRYIQKFVLREVAKGISSVHSVGARTKDHRN